MSQAVIDKCIYNEGMPQVRKQTWALKPRMIVKLTISSSSG